MIVFGAWKALGHSGSVERRRCLLESCQYTAKAAQYQVELCCGDLLSTELVFVSIRLVTQNPTSCIEASQVSWSRYVTYKICGKVLLMEVQALLVHPR